MGTLRSKALYSAKQGFTAAIRRAKYEGWIGAYHYSMDRDAWTVTVTCPNESGRYTFLIAKSWIY